MKTSIITFIALFMYIFSSAQSPQALNYQAVARNIQGQIISAHNIGVRFSILDGSVNGNILYQETQTATTNSFGLFTLAIGRGTNVSGTFADIDWGSGDKFLKVEISTDGTANYQVQGTTQLLSVPYALYSEKTRLIAGNGISITNGNTISANASNYVAGTGISITGTTISHNLKAGPGIRINQDSIIGNYIAGTGIGINGNTISANYLPGIGINISGATISHNLKAGPGIRINQDSIIGNYQAGSGIDINGNIISATGSTNNFWQPDANGIYYNGSSVGIGGNSVQNVALNLIQTDVFGVGAGLQITSANTWHTALDMFNSTMGPNNEFSFSLGGSNNIEVHPQNFGIFNHVANTWGFIIDGPSNSVGIGMENIQSELIKSKLHVFGGDINIEQIGSGIIMKSPNGKCWRITIDNAGNFVSAVITCP